MKILFLSLFFTYSLFASKILGYNVYDRSNRVDVMFTFDVPYSEKILQHKKDDKIIIKLIDTQIDESKIKTINSQFLTKLTILPLNGDVQIILKTPRNIKFQASQTSDKYGLRFRFTKEKTISHKQLAQNSLLSSNDTNLDNIPTKKDYALNSQYMIVVGVLLFLLAILYLIKNRFPKNSATTAKFKGFSFKNSFKDGVSVKFQKAIDTKNRVVLLEYGDMSYLVLMGPTNVVLDKFQNGEVATNREQFHDMLKDEGSKLDEFLRIEPQNSKEAYPNKKLFFETSKIDEAYDSYKEKASIL